MALTLREILKSSGDVTLTLRSGTAFHGRLGTTTGDLVELQDDQGQRHYLVASEIAAVTIAALSIAHTPAPITQAKVEHIGDQTEGAHRMLSAVTEALRALGPTAEAEIHTIRLFEGQSGRFRVTDGVLEAGYLDDEDPPSARELQSLLAAIL